MEKTRWPYIPQDIVAYEILPRLPARAIVRLQCVSKSWQSLILDDPHFVRLQLARAHSSPAAVLLTEKPEPTLCCADPKSVGLPKLCEQFDQEFWLAPRILASCKGIFCVRNISHDRRSAVLYVGNPVLNDWIRIPPHCCRVYKFNLTAGLAVYEMESGVAYKLVVPFCLKNIEQSTEVGFKVFASTTSSWVFSKWKVQMNGQINLPDDYATNVEGTLFWKHYKKVIWFDTKEERCGTFALPSQFNNHRRQSLGEWNGHLSFMIIADGEILIWSWNQYFWIKRLSLTIETIARENLYFFASLGLRMNLRNRTSESLEAILQRSSVDIVAFAANIIILDVNKKHICYDAITGKVWQIKSKIWMRRYLLFPYVNSLLKLTNSQAAE